MLNCFVIIIIIFLVGQLSFVAICSHTVGEVDRFFLPQVPPVLLPCCAGFRRDACSLPLVPSPLLYPGILLSIHSSCHSSIHLLLQMGPPSDWVKWVQRSSISIMLLGFPALRGYILYQVRRSVRVGLWFVWGQFSSCGLFLCFYIRL